MKNIEMYDRLDPATAVRNAWSNPGAAAWSHRAAQDDLRKSMPLLARALDRLVDSHPKA